MKFFSIVLSLCLHLIVIVLLVHFTCVSQKHVSKEEKLYKVSLVSLHEKKVRKVTYVKKKPTKRTKSVPKKVTKKKEIVTKTVPEKKSEKKKEMVLLEKVREEIHSKKIEEMREKEIEKRKSTMREELQGEGEKQEKVGSYKDLLKSIIEENWFLNKAFIEEKNLKTMVTIKLSDSGDVSEKKLEESSGNDYFDRTVMNAISYSNPLPSVPIDLRENHGLHVELYFTLEEYEKLHN